MRSKEFWILAAEQEDKNLETEFQAQNLQNLSQKPYPYLFTSLKFHFKEKQFLAGNLENMSQV